MIILYVRTDRSKMSELIENELENHKGLLQK